MNNAMNTHQHHVIFLIFSLLSAIPSAVCLIPAAELTCLSVLLPQAVMHHHTSTLASINSLHSKPEFTQQLHKSKLKWLDCCKFYILLIDALSFFWALRLVCLTWWIEDNAILTSWTFIMVKVFGFQNALCSVIERLSS